MGREIRRVPKGWEHPRDNDGHFLPMHDKDYESACQEWAKEFLEWEAGTHPDRKDSSCEYYWEWAGWPPSEEYYRPKFESEPTYYQIYETVSEGTPVSPVFESLEEMRLWLLKEGFSEKASAAFVELGHAPSMIFVPGKGVSGIGIHSLDWVD